MGNFSQDSFWGLGDLGLLVVILKEFSLFLFFSGTKLVRKWQIYFFLMGGSSTNYIHGVSVGAVDDSDVTSRKETSCRVRQHITGHHGTKTRRPK